MVIDKKNYIYLDYQSTTPIDSRVLTSMMPFLQGKFANPHSIQHGLGKEVESAVECARKNIAMLIDAQPKEIIFTSGATESNNLAIKGAARFYRSKGKNELVTLSTEHKCVIESMLDLEKEGFKVYIVPVKKNGIVDLDILTKYITNKTSVVSVMAVNNETGVLQPIKAIGKLCNKVEAVFHSDAAQAAGKIDLSVKDMNIGLMSLSSHKMYGPKGIGVLYIRRKPRVRLLPLFSGGGQERGIRSGTLAAHLCIGFGEACRIAKIEMKNEKSRLSMLSKKFINGIKSQNFPVSINGSINERWPGNLNILFSGIDAEKLIRKLSDICISTGSACTDSSLEPSYVLRAMGLSLEDAKSSVRIGFGRMSTEKEVEEAIKKFCEVLRNSTANF